jgi:hypothetical protein
MKRPNVNQELWICEFGTYRAWKKSSSVVKNCLDAIVGS